MQCKKFSGLILAGSLFFVGNVWAQQVSCEDDLAAARMMYQQVRAGEQAMLETASRLQVMLNQKLEKIRELEGAVRKAQEKALAVPEMPGKKE